MSSTFLFTDIEGSPRFWLDHPDGMSRIQALHDALVAKTIEDQGGHVFKNVGDQTCAFPEAAEALLAAAAVQGRIPQGLKLRDLGRHRLKDRPPRSRFFSGRPLG